MMDYVRGFVPDGSQGNNPVKKLLEETMKLFPQDASLCNRCIHKDVCKFTDEKREKCLSFLNDCRPEIYGNIHDMLRPIFDWMKIHYPSGEVLFLVESNKAQLWQEHKLSAYSKELMDIVNRTVER